MANFCSECGKALEPNANFCTVCGASVTGVATERHNLQSRRDAFARKRQKVLGNPPQVRRQRTLKFLGGGIVLLLGGWVFVSSLPSRSNPTIEAQPAVSAGVTYPKGATQMFEIPAKVENGKISIPLELVQQRKFVVFNYPSATTTIPLLAYISGEGKLVTAVSMCEPCNSQRFHIRGENLVCNSCGTTWELDNLSAISGACGKYPPDAIPSVVVGNEVQIDEGIVANWQRRI